MPRDSLRPALPGDTRSVGHSIRDQLLRTFPGIALLAGAVIRLLLAVVEQAGVPAQAVRPIEALSTLALVVGGGYFLIRLSMTAQRRLLWRVRRKLILSYIFIGFIPALLIVAFFLLCGLMLFFNFSSYLVQSRLRILTDQTRSIAQKAAAEIQRAGPADAHSILERTRAIAEERYPGISVVLLPAGSPACAGDTRPHGPSSASRAPAVTVVGPWAHVDPPTSLPNPNWIDCGGFGGLLAYSGSAGTSASSDDRQARPERRFTPRPPIAGGSGDVDIDLNPDTDVHLAVRAVAFPESALPSFAVVVDVPVKDAIVDRLKRDTGIQYRSVTALPITGDVSVRPMPGREQPTAAARQEPAAGTFGWVTVLDYTDWTTGKTGNAFLSIAINIRDMYERISADQARINGRGFGQAVLLVLLLVVGGLFLVIEAVALVMGLALAKSITGSVHALFTGTERVRRGDFTHKIEVKARDQLGELADSFNSMTASIEDLLQQAAEKKRLEEELRIAREIQMSLLPQAPHVMPGLSVTALCVPAREVGGDYYDFLTLDAHRLGVLIADVSGKGTSAALYMAELKGLMLSLSQIHRSPRELLINANRIIAENLDSRSFITMTYAVLDLAAQTMTYARAGHTPLIYLPASPAAERRARVLAPDGLVLGLKIDNGEMFEQLLEEATLPLHRGDLFLFFTDGISEAMNVGSDFFGESRLSKLIEEHCELPSEELRERILREIQAFVGEASQHDDMTMILLKVEALMDGERATAAAAAVGVV